MTKKKQQRRAVDGALGFVFGFLHSSCGSDVLILLHGVLESAYSQFNSLQLLDISCISSETGGLLSWNIYRHIGGRNLGHTTIPHEPFTVFVFSMSYRLGWLGFQSIYGRDDLAFASQKRLCLFRASHLVLGTLFAHTDSSTLQLFPLFDAL